MSGKSELIKRELKSDCVAEFSRFVRELDRLLRSNPSKIDPVHNLINQHFPMTVCDIHEAISVARKSRFFSHISEEKTYYVLAFDSRGFAGDMDQGFHVQINFLKASGESWLPSAHVNPRLPPRI